ncbi:hypothetical protein ACIG0C_28855 [Kitasatospora aureofaciens]|uniref:Chaplin domain-containing protein n=2 Tax=Kitasatospora aureofaciens TaxID=1894 RepID=A0A1E7NER9_KITAU|nr:hypothetical protein [Kitasatospora aureofaciens]OEV39201.1 hypothetical protein HS99_0000260 [Kitasatospora aureofaciens]QEV03103.1 hypothetical protein CP971_31250 [Streptomyces viridifaciens]UKZ09757.1 hypothetical protein BOQ63_038220 [Streptomyces viridifaciens]
MKKRSMLAVASIAVGFVASLTAPSAHASAVGGQEGMPGPVTGATDAVPGQVGDAGGVVGRPTGFVTGTVDGLTPVTPA